jgi:Domain of unknown function (DUF4105)
MKFEKTLILPLLLLTLSAHLFTQELTGEELEARLLIIGQGDPLYSQWGHTGLAIRNTLNNRDVFYDFGNFYFEDDDFFKNFAIGRLLYIAWAAHTEPYIQSVLSEKRDLTEFVLDLPAMSKLNMYNALKNKALPENRTYLYHHYNDNCSTRIRDYIDDAVYGQLYENTDFVRGSTFRKSFLLFTSNKQVAGSMLSILQGPFIDKDITIWQEMFLPQIMEEVIRDFTYTDTNGQERSLVKKTNVLYRADHRKPLPEKYSPPYGAAVLISCIITTLILFLNFRSLKGKRTLFSIFNILSGFTLGILGSVLLFLAGFTDHSYSFYNINLFMINPLALFIIPSGIMYWRKGDIWRKKLNLLWTIQLISTVVMVLLKIFTPVKQDNHIEIILILPMLIAFSPLVPSIFKRKTIGAILGSDL